MRSLTCELDKRFDGINARCFQRDTIKEFAYRSPKFLVSHSRILGRGCILLSCYSSWELPATFDFRPRDRPSLSLRTPIPSICGTQRCKKKRVALSHFHPNAEGSVVRSPLNDPPFGGFAEPGYISIPLLPTCLSSPGTARMHSIVSLEIVKHEKLA